MLRNLEVTGPGGRVTVTLEVTGPGRCVALNALKPGGDGSR